MTPDLEIILRLEQQFPERQRWIIAFSGGLDSHVLLHLVARYAQQRGASGPTLLALHVNQGLHPQAGDWQQHCARVCHDLDIAFQTERVTPDTGSELARERAARKSRYQVFESHAGAGDLLLQAQHRDDQAETVLLRLLRGAGPIGLSGVPRQRPFGQALLARPLLDCSRQALLDYAQQFGLRWIQDISDASGNQDRNFLRYDVLPLLGQRWPDVVDKLTRTAETCRDAAALKEDVTRGDLQEHLHRDRFGQHFLELDGLASMEPPRLRNLLRQWLWNSVQFTPSRVQLQQLRDAALEPRTADQTCLNLDNNTLRGFDGCLYLVPLRPANDVGRRISVKGAVQLNLDTAGHLGLRVVRGQGLRADGEVEVRFADQPMSCRLNGDKTNRDLDEQMRRLGVPPWLHEYLPLLFVDGELAALADLAVCAGYGVTEEHAGLLPDWRFAQYND